MSEVAKAVKPLFDKFIDFFDIFDLSFFVSGATFVGAIAWARLTPDLEILLGYQTSALIVEDTLIRELPGVGVIVLVLASYISGMTCFAAGRFCRKWSYRAYYRVRRWFGWSRKSALLDDLAEHGMIVRRRPAAQEPDAGWMVTAHGQTIAWLPRYIGPSGEVREAALYVRMWAEVRQRELLAPSFSLLRRYWVSSATLDGLFIALGTWAVLLSLVQFDAHGWVPSAVTLVGACFCLREAQRYGDYQRQELVATLLLAYDMPGIEAAAASTPPTSAPSAAVSFAADASAMDIAAANASAAGPAQAANESLVRVSQAPSKPPSPAIQADVASPQ